MNPTTASRLITPSADLPDRKAELSVVEPSTTAAEDRRQPILGSTYPDHCKRVLLAFLDLIEAREWSQAEAAKKIKHGPHQKPISNGTLSALLKGSYGADPRAICASVERLLNLENGRAQFADIAFVKTELFRVFETFANVTVVTRGISYLHGSFLSGKTVNAQALAHLYRNATPVFLTMPYAGSYGGFIKRLAAVRQVETNGTLDDVRERILSALDEHHLLIVDEAHQPNLNYSHSQAVRVFEFLREINDLCRCPILLIGHSEGFHDLTSHGSFEHLAGKVVGKSLDPYIPTAQKNDLLAILAAYKLPEPSEADLAFCRDIIKTSSLARLFDLLRLASGRAENKGQRLDWTHVNHIHRTLLSLN
jgi:DNA transposition AAA+ family ATPase